MVFGAIALGFLSSRALQGPTSVTLPEPEQAIRGFVEAQPIRFEPNHGQRRSSGAFFARGLGYSLELSPSEARLSLTGKTSRAELRMRLVGASESANARPLEALPGRHNYYLGRGAPTLDVPLYRKVRFDNIYEGIDIVYYGAGRKLEYDLVVAPGADPSLPRLELLGQTGLVVEPDGSLAVSLGERTVDFSRPFAYQLRDGEREPVEAEYVLLAEAGSVGFRIGEYDPKRELVIDPVLGFATFFGGDGFDLVEGVGVASTGQVYITGLTDSSDLPVTNGSSQQGAVDGFVARYSPLGVLEFATYFGGSGLDRPRGLSVDGTDRVLVTGDTTSADFPRTIGPLALSGPSDVFVARFNTDGTILYARYLGGSGVDGFTAAIAADTDGNAYLTGETQSADFPVVFAESPAVTAVAAASSAYASGGQSVSLQGPADAFVARIDSTGVIYWSDFLGGTGFDRGTAIAVDNASQAYVVGLTDSPDFPADGTSFGGGASDAFIARFDDFGLLLNSDFVGGSGSESGSGIGLYLTDLGAGVAYVAGTTSSADLPLPVNMLTGPDDAFVSRFDFSLSSITHLWTRYIGGTTALESAEALSVDLAGNALITGKTRSSDFPTTDGTTLSGFEDVFAARVNLEGGLPDATLFGGSGTNEAGFAVAAALSGAAWVGGETNDTDFPATDGTTRSASSDGFLARVEFPLEEGDLVFDESRLGIEAVRKLNLLNNEFADLSVTLSGSFIGLVESVAVEPAGTILLSENSSFSSSLPVIHRLDPGSGIAATLTSGMLLNDALGRMAIAADGSILIVSNSGSLSPPRALIRVDSVSGAQSVVSTDAQMGGTVTRGIAVEPDGMIVALIDNTVARIDPMTGTSTTLTMGMNLAAPAGVTIAANGDLFVVDPSNGVLVAVDPLTGVQTLLATADNLDDPSAVVVDRVGDVLIRDTLDFQIVRLDSLTFLQTVVHSPASVFSGDDMAMTPCTPTIATVTPASLAAGLGATAITITGECFTAGTVALADATALATTVNNSTSITATIGAGQLAAAGTLNITVQHPAPGAAVSNALPLVVAGPAISALTPPGPICAGDPAFTMLTVDGANFTPAAEVRWNGAALVTGFVNSMQLTAAIPGALAAMPGFPVITVVNLPGGIISPGAPLTISPPSVGSVVPSQAFVGDAATPIAVNGACFVPGSEIVFDGQALQTTFVNATQLTATVPAANLATAGTFLVRVMNPGGASSADVSFNVLTPVPVLTSVSPTAATAGGAAFTLTANGSSFLMGAAIEWDGVALPTAFVNSTQLTAAVSSALIAAAGTPLITVRNPPPDSPVSTPLPFIVAAPAISALTPPGPICAGDPAFTMLTVGGANFTPAAEVRWNGAALVTGFVDATQLTAAIPGALAAVAGPAAITVVNLPGGATSPAAPLTVSPPALGSIVPNQAFVGDAATPVVANGSCFVPGSDLVFDGAALQTTFVDPTQLTATVPAASLAAAGSFLVRAMNPGGASSADVSFNVVNLVPVLSSVSPTGAAARGAAFTLTVGGSNFLAGAVIEWDGDALPTDFVSPNQLTATVSPEFFPDGGTALITVRNPPPSSAVSAPLTFTVTNPAPTLTSLSPSSATVGSQGVTVRLTGAGFVPSSQARFDGSTVSTTFLSSTELSASLGASALQSVGSQTVSVRNPSPGGGVSNALRFDVVAPIPTISALTPPSTAAGGVDLTLTVSGSNFESGSSVEWQGSALATTFASSRSLTAIVPAELIAINGTANIVVVNPNGERSSLEPFLILSPAPELSSISPTRADAGDPAFTLAITGEGFLQSSFAQWNGQPLPTVFQGPTQLSASVSASLIAVEGAAQVTVRNLPPGGGTSGPAVFTIGPQALVSIAVSPTQVIFPPTAAGESTSRTVTVSNTGESSLSLTAGVNDPGFSVSPGTFSLNVGAVRDLTVVYAPAAPGSDSGVLRLSGDGISTNVPVSGTATEPPGGIEIQDPGGDAISGSVLIEPIEVGSTASQGVRIVGAGPGVAQLDRIAVSGAGFTLVGVPPLPLFLGPGEVIVVTIMLRPQEPGPLSGQLLVNDDSLPILGRGLLAGISITGVPGILQGGQQEQAGLSSARSYSTPIAGVLRMDFTPEEAGGVDDPAARFENGSRSAAFTIPAGDSSATFGDARSIGYQSGTSAGTLSFRAKLAVSGGDVTPVPAPTASGVIRSDAAPTLTSLSLEDRTTNGFTIVLEGFAPGRNVDRAAIRFGSAPGASVNPATFDVNVAAALDEWFASAESAAFGSQFALRLAVTIAGQISAVSSVTASVSNENGSSNTLETSL